MYVDYVMLLCSMSNVTEPMPTPLIFRNTRVGDGWNAEYFGRELCSFLPTDNRQITCFFLLSENALFTIILTHSIRKVAESISTGLLS